MDYVYTVVINFYSSFHDFKKQYKGRVILFDTKANIRYCDVKYEVTDCIMLGKESSGVSDDIYELCDEKVVIPMVSGQRSFNVAMSGAMAISEVLRQLNFLKN